MADIQSVPVNQNNNVDLKNLPTRPTPLSQNDEKDLANLIKVAKEKQKKFKETAEQTAEANHEKIGEMPIPKTEHDLITDAVTGSIAKSDIADAKQNKLKGDIYYILVSSSLSDDELRSIMSQYKNRNDVALVIRGVKDKNHILEELTHWQQLVLDSGSSTTVNLDPTIFQNYKVTSVPTIIHEKDGDLVARVTGISNIDYLKDKKGNLGVEGPAKDISEISMLDLIAEKIKKLDFDKMKKDALNNYWKEQHFTDYPDALKRVTRTVTPSVNIPQDIVSPNGQIIAKKGSINPLQVFPFRLKLIFFDARFGWQRAIARREYQNAPQGIKPMLITTQVYGDGWQPFQDAEKEYGENSRLFLIQPDMDKRFDVKVLPTVVTSESDHYVINEYPKEDAQK